MIELGLFQKGLALDSKLAQAQKLTIRQSIACVKLKLWDERAQRLVSFREVRR